MFKLDMEAYEGMLSRTTDKWVLSEMICMSEIMECKNINDSCLMDVFLEMEEALQREVCKRYSEKVQGSGIHSRPDDMPDSGEGSDVSRGVPSAVSGMMPRVG